MRRPLPLRLPLWKALVGVAGFLAVATIAVVLVSAEVRYLMRAAYEEARILLKRRSLEALAIDTTVAPDRRAAFELVLAARTFAADSLGLEAGDTYTTFSDVGRDTLLLVISASPKTSLEPYVWRYPIVGRVPYKGFFRVAAARAAAERLEADGYDTYLRPAGAFSTLGWFNDPLLSTALYRDPVSLVATVIHEIAHNTLYVPGATKFNESFASFAGYRGAEAFFASRGEMSSAQRAARMWQDEIELADFFHRLAQRLEDLYSSGYERDEVLTQREVLFAAARDTLLGQLGGRLQTYRAESLARRTLNNASVIAAQIYRTNLASFDILYHRLDCDVARTVAALTTAIQRDPAADPYQTLAQLMAP
ncbi:MAG: aminopeptidase [Gemmatimonadota bacterium]|nr:MAG: aminopeptidase [Gemmatimonadota bacterium]